MGGKVQGAAERKSCSSVRREVEVEEIGEEELETAMRKIKKQGDRGRWSAARDVGDDWRGGSQVDRNATERVYAGGKDTERVEDGPDSADMEEEGGCAWHRKVPLHHTTTQPSIENCWRGF